MKIAYTEKLRLNLANQQQLVIINKIIEEYSEQGYKLTLRQLYYQLVSRDIIPNKQSEYAKLSTLLTKGRMAGIVDWDAIEDRLRVPDKPASWDNPKEIIEAAAEQYRRNRMDGQEYHIEVWVEKDALSGVLRRSTVRYGIHLMVNRGYSSTSAMHDSFQRFKTAIKNSQKVVILYLGDHDPSGIDMVRDIRERTRDFFWGDSISPDFPEGNYKEFIEWFKDHFEIRRIALTMEQIDEYNPPPNPAKTTDPRGTGYIEKYGAVSWEVDALPPDTLNRIIDEHIIGLIDEEKFQAQIDREKSEKKSLFRIAKDFKED